MLIDAIMRITKLVFGSFNVSRLAVTKPVNGDVCVFVVAALSVVVVFVSSGVGCSTIGVGSIGFSQSFGQVS